MMIAANTCPFITLPWSVAELELQAQHPLNDAWAPADNPSRCADGRGCRASDGCGDLAEVRISLIANGKCEVRVIEKIKEFGPELEAEPFRKREILTCSKVPALQTRTIVLVAAGSPDASCLRSFREVCRVECGVDIPVLLVKPPGADDIGPVIELG